jgi:2,3-bisphosphoglycerate-dependent phosphoglycerate mutase
MKGYNSRETDVMNETASVPENCERGRVLIIRHAQSAANAGGRTTDQAIIPITNIGIRQAHCVADLVWERPSVIVVSYYLRTAQTAQPLLRRHAGVPVEQWRVEEFTYLNTAACAGTTYNERQNLRDAYWARCDPFWVDGPDCECFTDFIGRVRQLERRLNEWGPDETVGVFTHGFVMRALLWFRQHTAEQTAWRVTGAEMAEFYDFQRSVSVPNCSVLRGSPDGSGRLLLSTNASVAHIPVDLRTE